MKLFGFKNTTHKFYVMLGTLKGLPYKNKSNNTFIAKNIGVKSNPELLKGHFPSLMR